MRCDQIRQNVADGRLMPAEAIEAALSDWLATSHEMGDGEGAIGLLIQQQLLTEFQGTGLMAGVSRPYRSGPYEVFDRLVAGCLGIVFRARHPEFDRAVALKIFPFDVCSDREHASRLTREFRIPVQADHPNVVRTFQVGRAGDAVCSAVEELQGEAFSSRLKRESLTATPSLVLGESCRLIREAALGMSYLHVWGVVLRDVQPASRWLNPVCQLKIMESGAAHDSLEFLDDADSAPTEQADELRWDFDYVSLEQGDDQNSVDFRGGIYSLGCVAFQWLTGRVVFTDKNPLRKMIRHARDSVPTACRSIRRCPAPWLICWQVSSRRSPPIAPSTRRSLRPIWNYCAMSRMSMTKSMRGRALKCGSVFSTGFRSAARSSRMMRFHGRKPPRKWSSSCN